MDIINKIWLRFSTENSTKQSKIIVQQTTKVKPMLKRTLFFMMIIIITTNKRSAFFNHVEFLGFKLVSKGPTSSKFPIPTPEAPCTMF